MAYLMIDGTEMVLRNMGTATPRSRMELEQATGMTRSEVNDAMADKGTTRLDLPGYGVVSKELAQELIVLFLTLRTAKVPVKWEDVADLEPDIRLTKDEEREMTEAGEVDEGQDPTEAGTTDTPADDAPASTVAAAAPKTRKPRSSTAKSPGPKTKSASGS